MNYNPYYFTPYIMQAPARAGLFSNLFKGAGAIKWSSILGGTQKALNIANQAIPVIKQVTPMMKNAKTMFKVMNEFKKVDTPTTAPSSNTTINNNTTANENNVNEINNQDYTQGPTFFI